MRIAFVMDDMSVHSNGTSATAERYAESLEEAIADGHAPDDAGRLDRLDALIAETAAERDQVVGEIDKLKSQGKVRTATFQQLLARKMTLDSFMSAFERHGLV